MNPVKISSKPPDVQSRRQARRGMTLPELAISLSILLMVGAATASLSKAGRLAMEQAELMDLQARTSRMALQQIRSNVERSHGNTDFPAAVVFTTSVGGQTFPDTLVLWRPVNGVVPVNPQGLPFTDELLFYFADPNASRRLIESRVLQFPSIAPPLSDSVGWDSLIQSAKTYDEYGQYVDWTELSDGLRTVVFTDQGQTKTMPAMRFEMTYTPSSQELLDHQANLVSWENLAWPLGRVSQNHGARVATCNVELQLRVSDIDSRPLLVTGSAEVVFQVSP